jgi:hypothetical protein
MRKILTALVAAATIGGAALATSAPANAWRGGWGWGWGLGGFAAGAIVGSALAAPYYYAPYGYYGRRPAFGVACGTVITGFAPASEHRRVVTVSRA